MSSKYIRDKRSPVPSSEKASRIMSSIKSKNTKPEVIFRKFLWHNGIKGYRLHCKNIEGKPDIAFPGKKIAIFVHGCYWHRCPKCNLPVPKSNTSFWDEKFRKNQERDLRKLNNLKKLGWDVEVIWECEIKNDIDSAYNKVKNIVDKK